MEVSWWPSVTWLLQHFTSERKDLKHVGASIWASCLSSPLSEFDFSQRESSVCVWVWWSKAWRESHSSAGEHNDNEVDWLLSQHAFVYFVLFLSLEECLWEYDWSIPVGAICCPLTASPSCNGGEMKHLTSLEHFLVFHKVWKENKSCLKCF